MSQNQRSPSATLLLPRCGSAVGSLNNTQWVLHQVNSKKMVDAIEVAKKWVQGKEWPVEGYQFTISPFQSCPEGNFAVSQLCCII